MQIPRTEVWKLRQTPMPMPRQSIDSRKHSHHHNFLLFLLLTLVPHVASAANDEVVTLHSWLNSFPSPSPAFANWNRLDPNPCNWSYITCSSENFVTQINIQSIELALSFPSNLPSLRYLQELIISNANLTGMIPSEIGDCTALTVLDVSSNSLVGSVPASLGKLRNLQVLILNSNQLTGTIPAELGGCINLKNLFLFDNHFSGIFPAQLGKLSKLEVIRAGGNKDITGKIPAELGDCQNLKVLGLADTKISGSIPSSLGRLSKLQTLSVYTTMLSGVIPPDLGNCSELVNMFLYENSLSGALPPELGCLLKLEKMLLWENNLVGTIPEEIGNCRSLKIIDLSLNSFAGGIPRSFGNLSKLEALMISNNNISGSIPAALSNATKLVQLQVDTNQISGSIPEELGVLTELNVFYAWQNKLEGSIPSTLGNCRSLQAVDLSHNSLSGSIPPGLFQLQNLTKLLLISNDISGSIPREIGKCSSLIRLRLVDNRISGEIPKEIGFLNNLSFLDLSQNRLVGSVPDEIGNCTGLQMLNLSNNTLGGTLPSTMSSITGLEVLDVSENQFVGQIPGSFGHLSSLNRLILSRNSFSGSIPPLLGHCSSLQLLDLSSNMLSGSIPKELFEIESLDIALNLSWNGLTGTIPPEISALSKLSVLDVSHNMLGGDLMPLSGLENLVSLNISHNNFTGYLPDNKFFRELPAPELEGNRGLCSSSRNSCFLSNATSLGISGSSDLRWSRRLIAAIVALITVTVAMAIIGIVAVFRTRKAIGDDNDSELGGDASPWQFTPFQKLNFSVEQVVKCLVEPNVIGKGCSGIVYCAEMENGEVIAVKKLWPTTMAAGYACKYEQFGVSYGVRDSFSAEVKTLGSIRHKNIVRFLGCCWNRNTRLLMYDYMPNGSLGGLLHERGSICLEWDLRYRIILGAAEGLAYLHHDCVPPIVHRDIKANNILIGLEFEPYIADFGLAKLVDDGDFARSSNTVAGSYGYIAPEYGYMMKITEKSDVYSYGVVVLEVLTGKQPIDPTIPDGLHIVDWVRQRRGGIEVLDPSLRARPESEIEEMMQTLGVALLCVNPSPEERPTMKDVAAMLKEISHEREECVKVDMLLKGLPETGQEENNNSVGGPSTGMQCSHPQTNDTSFSASSLLYSSSANAQMAFKSSFKH
ncbi:LRR receptor-like serine/threonine-protein kinase RGI2 [Malania oleifera]|uniref:LRR receptor-like serine/threonine-protein kinase RGI2 n=1 Tax=Malania oleifera TaxID=397392 RepID=UPI0025AEADC5|nr:LRR receptor-like serine/threonine-protein kinase RGI2 [Malania oleifera]XP_057964773.1 LRR receptor-like serine/threonine-protein kinase RGI2 [Malania oleifera]